MSDFDYARAILGHRATPDQYREFLRSELARVDKRETVLDCCAQELIALGGSDDDYPFFGVLYDLAKRMQSLAGVETTSRLTFETQRMFEPDPERAKRIEHARSLASDHARYPVAAYVYRYFNNAGRLLYVGYTATPQKRNLAHARDKEWILDAVQWEVVRFPDEDLARAAESDAIRTENPIHNKAGRES